MTSTHSKVTTPPGFTKRTLLLLAWNVVLIVQAVIFRWDLGTMVWIYYLQGVIIVLAGLLTRKHIFTWVFLLGLMAMYLLFMGLRTFPVEGMNYYVNDVQVSAEEVVTFSRVSWNAVALNSFIMAIMQLVGYVRNGREDQFTASFWEAVERLLPLHLVILLASTSTLSTVLFMVLKSATDVLSYGVVRWVLAYRQNSK